MRLMCKKAETDGKEFFLFACAERCLLKVLTSEEHTVHVFSLISTTLHECLRSNVTVTHLDDQKIRCDIFLILKSLRIHDIYSIIM